MQQLASFFGRVYVQPVTGCWLWKGSHSTGGYAMYAGFQAKRAAYSWFVSVIPSAHDIDHLCRVRACVNPAHLDAVTHAENMARVGRIKRFCSRGHLWIPSNLVPQTNYGKVRMVCGPCRAIRRQREREKRNAA